MNLSDFRYAARTLVKSPGFTAVAVLTIALGIGANTAIFTVVNALLLRPLPYHAPERLVMVWQDFTGRGGPADEWATPGNVRDWRSEPDLFEGLAAISGWRPTMTGEGEADAIPGEQVTHDYFPVLGVTPIAGRGFQPADDVPNAPRVVMISDGFWKLRFGGDPAVVGRPLTLSGEPHEIIGVIPAGFRPIVNPEAEIWRPSRLNMAEPSRGAIFLRVVARLPEGLSLEQGQARATAMARRLEAEQPQFNDKVGFNLQPLHDRVVGDVRPGLLALLGGVAFVLLIACTNVANLLMARGSGRGRELAVRVALGASRWRVMRQLLTESFLLAALGGAAGLIIATWAVDALVAMAPPGTPRLAEISLDPTVFGFAALLTLATGLLFGVAPALQHSRVEITTSLKDGGRGTTGGGRNFRRVLVAAEVALALVLLTGGMLLIQTFARLQAAELGFHTENVLVGGFSPPASYDTRAKYTTLYEQVLERASAIPGVRQAALSSVLPLAQGDSDMDFLIEGRPRSTSASEATVTWYREVSAGYFDAIGMRVARGRGFEPNEAMRAVIINETFAQRFFPGEDPLGRRLQFGSSGENPWFTIVGVAADARVRGAREPTRVEMFIPFWQYAERGMAVVLTGSNAAQFAPALREVVASVDPNMPLTGVRTMEDILRTSLGQPRFLATLSGAFAALALLLSAIGIYGVMAYAVTQRTTEIGVRMAMGATMGGVFRLVVGDGLRVALLGVIAGTLGALGIARWLGNLLFGIGPTDPLTLASTAAVLLAVAAAASVVPAWRASRVDPMVALRGD